MADPTRPPLDRLTALTVIDGAARIIERRAAAIRVGAPSVDPATELEEAARAMRILADKMVPKARG